MMATETMTCETVRAGATAIRVAAVVSAHFGHTWGGVWGDCGGDPAGPRDEEEIRARVMDFLAREGAACGPAGWGITAPGIAADGSIIHTSATGRITWAVSPAGDVVTVVWRRPEGDILEATLSVGARIGIAASRCSCAPVFFHRHVEEFISEVDAIAEALGAALCAGPPQDDVFEARRSLLAQAEDEGLWLRGHILSSLGRLERLTGSSMDLAREALRTALPM